MELYLIRHAQSYNNALPDARERVCDPPLTEVGVRQANHLARHLSREPHPEQDHGRDPEDTHVHTVTGYGIRTLFCSAMHRSLHTASLVGEAIGVRPELWLDIHEAGGIFLDHGPGRGITGYPGKTRAEITSEFPGVVVPDSFGEHGWWDPALGEEDWPACAARAVRVLKQLWRYAEEGLEGPVALVSHAGFMEALVRALFGRLPGNDIAVYHFNTAITRFDLNANRQVAVRYLNRVPHLPRDLIT